MENILNTKGYNFYMIDIDQWIYDDNSGQVFDGTFASVVIHALRNGFRISDIEQGVEYMLNMNHDSIHFGAYKSPIYSFNRKEKKVA